MNRRNISMLICAAFAAAALLPLAACGDPSNDELARLNDLLQEQQQTIDELQEQLGALGEKIDRLETFEKDMDWQLGAPYGVFAPLDLAYDLGYLTRSDLMSIAWHLNGGSAHNEDLFPEGYEPTPAGTIDEELARAIRETDARLMRLDTPNANYEDVGIDGYYGSYAGACAVLLSEADRGVSSAVHIDNVGGVNFYYTDGRSIVIYFDRDDYRSCLIDDATPLSYRLFSAAEYDMTPPAQPVAEYIADEQAWQDFAEEYALPAKLSEQYRGKALVACLFSVPTADGRLVYHNARAMYGAWQFSLTYSCGGTPAERAVLVLFETDEDTAPVSVRLNLTV